MVENKSINFCILLLLCSGGINWTLSSLSGVSNGAAIALSGQTGEVIIVAGFGKGSIYISTNG